MLDKWMRKYIKDHEVELYPKKLLEFSSEEARMPEDVKPEKCILEIDLDNINIPELMKFLHTLDERRSASAMRAGRETYNISKLVHQERKKGIPPQIKT